LYENEESVISLEGLAQACFEIRHFEVTRLFSGPLQLLQTEQGRYVTVVFLPSVRLGCCVVKSVALLAHRPIPIPESWSAGQKFLQSAQVGGPAFGPSWFVAMWQSLQSRP